MLKVCRSAGLYDAELKLKLRQNLDTREINVLQQCSSVSALIN